MNPQLHYYSDSDCDANQFSDIFGVKDVEKDELNHYSGEERFQSNQFEYPNIHIVQQDSTQCSSEAQHAKKIEFDEISEDLHCYEEEESKSIIGEPQPQIKCQCSKSKCQQSYCECFARGKLCNSQCGCTNCKNDQMSKGLTKIIKRLKKQKRDKQRTPRFLQGCTCGKSRCINKFCSCHSDGKYCSSACKCVDCKNIYKFCLKNLNLQVQPSTNKQNNQILFILGSENSNKFNEFKNQFTSTF